MCTEQNIPWQLILLESVDSTNTFLLNLPSDKKKEGLVVRAKMQTQGRGRLGRRWESPREKGLWFSVLLKQVLRADKNYLLPFSAALAVARALKKIEGCDPEVKWPNDVLIHRKKVAGILLEQRGRPVPGTFLVVGIGINTHQTAEDFSEAYGNHATSLQLACGKRVDDEDLFGEILNQLAVFYSHYKQGNEKYIRQSFFKAGRYWGETVRLAQGNRVYEGTALGINSRGGLVLQIGDRERSFFAGDLLLNEWW
ncbi:MAG: biotin--[acetyl-CoA-carboxylase] ligase [Calditrichaeota bacterium]|nr:biotin--[acetyl-CoA-carboxylase] ligase [Calditrichota bacterium]